MSKEKKYYTISEVAEILNIKQSKIRYWEKEFSQFIKPRRNRKGNRMFTLKDVENLKLIKHLVEDFGLKLKGAKQYLKYKKSEIEAKIAVVEKLKNIKYKLEELRDSID